MAEKDFYFKFYAGEFLLDEKVDILPDPAQLLLVKMWCLCCLHGYAPADPVLLAKRVKMDASVVQLHLQSVIKFFCKLDDDRLVSARLEAEMAKAGRVSKARSEVAKARWNKGNTEPEGPSGGSIGDAIASAIGDAKPIQLESELKKENTPHKAPQGGAGGEEKPKRDRPKRRTQKQVEADLLNLDIAPEAIDAAKKILEFWPTTDGQDRRAVGSSMDQLVPRLDTLSKSSEHLTLDLLVDAARLYCDAKRARYKSAQVFFSLEPDPATGKPFFREFAASAFKRRQAAAESAAQVPPPATPEPQPASA